MFQKVLYPHRFCRRRQILRVSKLTLFFCLLALTSSYARPFGKPSFPGVKVNGTVTSSLTKQGIPNATVSATDAKGNILTATKTNAQGYYQVSILSGSAKTVFIRIEAAGYQSQYKGDALSPYRTYTIGFSLIPIKLDTTAPFGRILINNRQRFTNSPQITLTISARDNPGGTGLFQMQFSNDNKTWSAPEAYATKKSWILSLDDGRKVIYAKFADKAENWSQVYSSAITLDTIAPVTSDLSIDGLWHNSPVTVTLTAQDPAFASELDSNTKLLLRLDGEDGSSTFKDEAGKAITPYGNARIDTAQSKFGTASLLLDGNSDYVTLPDSDDWNFGAGDFTIDCWVRFNNVGESVFVNQVNDTSNYLYFSYLISAQKFRFVSATGGVTDIDLRASWTPVVNTWYHVAVVRNGTTATDWYLFIDGVSQALQLSAGAYDCTLPNFSGDLHVGGDGVAYPVYHDGWIDEVRISKGIARWTSNFTPPTAFGSGVRKTYYSTDGSAPTIPYTNPFTLTDDGQYTIKYYSIDKAGNLEAVKTATDKVRIDKAPPEASIIINNQNQTSESWDVSLSLLADDTLSGMGQGAQMQFSNDNSNWSSPEDYSSVKPWKLSSGFGTKTVYAKFKDTAGNWSEDVSDTIEVVSIPKERIYIYLNGKRVAMEENGKKYFFHNDHLGSTSVMTDEAGEQVKYVEYKPYGDTKTEEGALISNKKFTGKELDESTGLYDYDARQYDAKLGRFISADTINPDLTNPQSLNRYSYALNNPLKYIDPSGHEPISAAVIAYIYAVISSSDFQQDIQQLALDAQAGDIAGMAIDTVSAAIPGLSATVAGAARKTISHAVDAASAAKAAKGAAQLERAAKAKTFSRFMTKDEAEAVEKTEYLRGARAGENFFTTNKYQTIKNAKSKLALETPPEVRLDFKIKNNPKVSIPERVPAKYGEPGGGIQFKTSDPVKVEVIRKNELR